MYGVYANEMGKLGLQGGMRLEYTGRQVESLQNGNQASIDRWDYFPTLHMSYNFSEKQQMMASYTRRIERPRGYYFEPFLTWEDAYNVCRGDPAIKPEYIDSYETGVQRFLGSNMLSLEGYYRITNKEDGMEIARVKTNMVFFDYTNRRMLPVPEAFRKIFDASQTKDKS